MPARLLGKGEARTALDLCAAPGGKTMQLAAAGFVVTAVDASESRLARLCENLARTRLEAAIPMADVMKWQPAAPRSAAHTSEIQSLMRLSSAYFCLKKN